MPVQHLIRKATPAGKSILQGADSGSDSDNDDSDFLQGTSQSGAPSGEYEQKMYSDAEFLRARNLDLRTEIDRLRALYNRRAETIQSTFCVPL